MAIKCALNQPAFTAAATKAGDVWPDGRLHLSRISRRTGVDRTALGRVTRGERSPDLATAIALARAYRTTVERLVSITGEPATPQANA